jgi:hypothetical protein
MYGCTANPFALAFRANKPAPNITDGLLVLVHDVIAAITTDPCFNEYVLFSYVKLASDDNRSLGNPYPLNPTWQH